MVVKPKVPRVRADDHIAAGKKRQCFENIDESACRMALALIDQTVKVKTLTGYQRKLNTFVRFSKELRGDEKLKRYQMNDFIMFVDAADNDWHFCANTIAGYLCAIKFFHQREHFGLVKFEPPWSETNRIAMIMKGLAYKAGGTARKGSRGAVNEEMMDRLLQHIAGIAEFSFLANPLRVLHYTGLRRTEFELMQKGDVHAHDDGTFDLYVRCEKRMNKNNPGKDFYYKPMSLKAVAVIRRQEMMTPSGEKMFTIKTAPRKKIQKVFEIGSEELDWNKSCWYDGYSMRHGFAVELKAKITKAMESAIVDQMAQQVITTFLGYGAANENRK
jgi:hypothetical protein